jgi:hypothetical protein
VQPKPALLPLADRIALLSPDGRHVSWLREDEAVDLIRQGRVELLGTSKKVRFVRQLPDCIGTPEQRLGAGHKTGPCRRHYSHKRETPQNPEGVWTLRRIPDWQAVYFLPPLVRAA